jgi:signal transduction histidine kinase
MPKLLRETPEPFPDSDDRRRLARLLAASLTAGQTVDGVCRFAVDAAREITAADMGTILLMDPDGSMAVRAQSGNYAPLPRIRVGPGEGLAGLAIQYLHPIQSDDLANDSRVGLKDYANSESLHGYLVVPMVGLSGPAGVLWVARRSAARFDEDTARALTAFASRVADALTEATARAARDDDLVVATTLLDASAQFSGQIDLSVVLAKLVDVVMESTGCDRCLIYLLDNDGMFVPSFPLDMADALVRALGELKIGMEGVPILASLVREHKTVICEDAYSHPLVPPDLARILKVCAFADVPILVGDRLLGLLVISYQSGPHTFSRRELAVAQGLARFAGTAIETARALARLESMLLAEERGRLASEVHDTLAQDLVAIATRMDLCRDLLDEGDLEACAEEMDVVRQRLGGHIKEVRRSIAGLRPLELERFGLKSAIKRYLDDYSQQTGIAVDFRLSGESHNGAVEVDTVLYRVAQEALNNVRKHARASHVLLDLAYESWGDVQLIIADDGKGGVSGDGGQQRPSHGMGLILMRERVERSGGTLDITSGPEGGTTITARIPRRMLWLP